MIYFKYDLIIRFSDVFSVGQWQNFIDINFDSEVYSLFQRLPGVMMSSKAETTQKMYKYAFNSWCKWTNSHSLSPLPATQLHVSLYLIKLSDSAKSVSKIDEAFYAISWAHKLAGYSDPCKTDLVVSVREGIHRRIGHSVVKKDPITPEILQKIVHQFGTTSNSLKDLRIACMCLLSYAGFLRFSELASLRRFDIQFFPGYVKLHLVQSKTDVYREGKDVVISNTNSITCPVSMLNRYLKLASICDHSSEFIFRSVSFCKSSNSYKLRNTGHISYTRAREILLSALEDIGIDKSKFGLHSLRSGGATAAAAAGIEDRLFKKHGRWKTDKAKDGYVKENIDLRLSVTRKLGL